VVRTGRRALCPRPGSHPSATPHNRGRGVRLKRRRHTETRVRAFARLFSLKQNDVNDDSWNRGRIAVQIKRQHSSARRISRPRQHIGGFPFQQQAARPEGCESCMPAPGKSTLLLLQHCRLHTLLPYHIFPKRAYKTLTSHQIYRDMQVDSIGQHTKQLFTWCTISYKQSILAWTTNHAYSTLLVASSVYACTHQH
jgi:hypothetical protein